MDFDNIDKICIQNNKIIFYKKDIKVSPASISGTIDGYIDVHGSKIINVANPTDPGDAANKYYIDLHIDNFNNPHKVNKGQIGLSYVENIKNNYTADRAPTVNDDILSDYTYGSRWIDISDPDPANHVEYVNVDPKAGDATWIETTCRGTITGGKNIGAGTGEVFAGVDGALIEFRTLKSDVMDIQTSGNEITFSNVTAANLATTGADVNVSGSAPPSTGQVLKATSTTTAEWSSFNGGNNVVMAIINNKYKPRNQDWVDIGYLPWDSNLFSGYGNATAIIKTILYKDGSDLDVRYGYPDLTTSTFITLTSTTITAPVTTYEEKVTQLNFSSMPPSNIHHVEMQVKISGGSGGTNPLIKGSSLEFSI